MKTVVIKSPVGATKAAQADITLGDGTFVIHDASILLGVGTMKLTRLYIKFRKLRSDGTYDEQGIGMGFTTPMYPFVLEHTKKVRGPGTIRADVMLYDATDYYNFLVTYERVDH